MPISQRCRALTETPPRLPNSRYLLICHLNEGTLRAASALWYRLRVCGEVEGNEEEEVRA